MKAGNEYRALEEKRLHKLREYGVLNPYPDPMLSEIIRLAHLILKQYKILLYFAGENRHWHKASYDLLGKYSLLNDSPLTHIMSGDGVTELFSVQEDPRFKYSQWLQQLVEVSYIAGCSLRSKEGVALGGLCVLGGKNDRVTQEQAEGLEVLAQQVLNTLELKRLSPYTLTSGLATHAVQSRYSSPFLQILNSSLDSIVCMDVDGNIAFWNDQAERVFGWSSDEVLGKPLVETIIPARYHKRHNEGFTYYMKTGNGPILRKRVEIEAVTKEQGEIDIELIVVPVEDERSFYFCGFIKNLTEQKRAKELFVEARENLERAEMQVSLGSWYFTADGHRHWSKQLYRLLGYDPDTLEPPPVEEWIQRFHPEDRYILQENEELMKAGEPLEDRVVRTNPEILPLRYLLPQMSEMRSEHGRIIRYQGTLLDISKSIEQLESLKRAEENYRQIFENSQDGIFQSKPRGRLMAANPALAEMFGYDSPDDMLKSINDIGLDLYCEKGLREMLLDKVRQNISVKGVELMANKKNGDKVWIQLNMHGIYDEGELVMLEGSIKDVTEQKLAKQKITLEKELSDSIINNLPGIFYLYNRKGRFLRWNHNFIQVTGYSPEELKRITAHDLFEEGEERELIKKKISEIFETGYAEVESDFLLKSGEKIPYYLNGWRIVYQNEPCVIGVGIDISERRKAEKELIASEMKLKAFFNNTSDGHLLLDLSGNVLSFNPVANRIAQNIWLEPLEEGSSIWHRMDKRHEPQAKLWFETVLEGEEIKEEINLPDGIDKSEWWLLNATLAKDNEKKAFGVAIKVINIEPMKQVNQRLMQSNEQINKAKNELDQFVYKSSHDLRGPLTSVLGLVNLAERDVSTNSFDVYLDKIRNSIVKLDHYIKDIIDFSYNSSSIVKKDGIDLRQLLEMVMDDLRDLPNADNIDIEINFDNQAELKGDFNRLKTVITNIVSNAILYQDVEKMLSLLVIKAHVDQKELRMSFRDNGIGIGLQFQDQAFDMFSRGCISSKGSGLGLYIVKEIINTLQGEVKIYSEEGLYTQVEFKVPNAS
ncbi:PAS domain S-box protein [Fulvivirga sediminis]|uniref:histidine kinase n=1 Tax=Fulvivirga sediminis TaxID=2803949 RepID=A0A937K2Q4_9BACT|nr:PAS domain S-box protein [Fulvivirga sediminis]MBL3658615.1 PAS domain S-box protein [Fulvivirga sediminis]